MKISATVTLKKDVLDPQGKVVRQTLKNMGYNDVVNVRQGKYFEIELNETDKEKAKKITEEICKKALKIAGEICIYTNHNIIIETIKKKK